MSCALMWLGAAAAGGCAVLIRHHACKHGLCSAPTSGTTGKRQPRGLFGTHAACAGGAVASVGCAKCAVRPIHHHLRLLVEPE
eukprot:1148251-Pelagomonas_calceolata.AAC.9